MKTSTLSLCAAVLFLLHTSFARTWTSSDGKTIEAEFVSSANGSVTIKRPDDKTFTLPLTRLSKADQDWVAAQLANPPRPKVEPITGKFAELITGDWALSQHGDLPFAFFGSTELSATKKYPLVLALHGKSENNENGKQLGNWIKSFASPDNYSKRPCFIVAPLCYQPYGGGGGGWSDKPGKETIDLVKQLIEHLPVDEKRVYTIGYSMGGFGVCYVMSEEPKLFAAGVPVAGYGWGAQVDKLKRHPIWLFHAADDKVVEVKGAREFAEALQRNKQFKYTEFPEGGHGIIGRVSDDQAVHEWLFAQGG